MIEIPVTVSKTHVSSKCCNFFEYPLWNEEEQKPPLEIMILKTQYNFLSYLIRGHVRYCKRITFRYSEINLLVKRCPPMFHNPNMAPVPNNGLLWILLLKLLDRWFSSAIWISCTLFLLAIYILYFLMFNAKIPTRIIVK